MTRPPLVLEGKTVGRLRASFILFKETFRFFCLDKEMFWVPIITMFLQLLLLGIACVLIFLPSGLFALSETGDSVTVVEYICAFVIYLISAFTIACSEGVITHIVFTRAHGGDASLGDGFRVVSKHFSAIFFWACITSTVGLIIRTIAERSQLLMAIVASIFGVVWSVLTYFTVPAIIIDNKNAIDGIRHSGTIFKRTWGETFASNISLGLVFFVFIVGLFLVLVGGLFLLGPGVNSLLAGILFFIAFIILLILMSVLNSVLKVLLYMYASEGLVPQNFNRELIEKMLARQQVPAAVPVPPSTTV